MGATTTCATCGETRGSFRLVGNVWQCLAHLRRARRANRDRRESGFVYLLDGGH